MLHTWQSLIDRARVYVDDDNYTDDGMLSPESWLVLASVEYSQLYRRFIRQGLITPAPVQETLTGNPHELDNGALAILGVAEDLGGSLRLLSPAQPDFGRDPFWTSATEPTGRSTMWKATGVGDTTTITLNPVDDSGATYFCRYIKTIAAADDPSDSIDLPWGADERLVLGLARRANLKGLTASALLERLLQEADAELSFQSFGKVSFPKPLPAGGVYARPSQRFGDVFPASPAMWTFL